MQAADDPSPSAARDTVGGTLPAPAPARSSRGRSDFSGGNGSNRPHWQSQARTGTRVVGDAAPGRDRQHRFRSETAAPPEECSAHRPREPALAAKQQHAQDGPNRTEAQRLSRSTAASAGASISPRPVQSTTHSRAMPQHNDTARPPGGWKHFGMRSPPDCVHPRGRARPQHQPTHYTRLIFQGNPVAAAIGGRGPRGGSVGARQDRSRAPTERDGTSAVHCCTGTPHRASRSALGALPRPGFR